MNKVSAFFISVLCCMSPDILGQDTIPSIEDLIHNERINLRYKTASRADYIRETNPDTMTCVFDNNTYTILSNGKIINDKSQDFVFLKNKDVIDNIYLYVYDNDFIIFFTETDFEDSFSYAKRINSKTKQIVWSNPIYAFNLGTPIIIDNNAYVSTLGFVGKLDLNSGKYIWRHEDLYDDGKFNAFENPIFLEKNYVIFPSPHYFTQETDYLLVNDNTGEAVILNTTN